MGGCVGWGWRQMRPTMWLLCEHTAARGLAPRLRFIRLMRWNNSLLLNMSKGASEWSHYVHAAVLLGIRILFHCDKRKLTVADWLKVKPWLFCQNHSSPLKCSVQRRVRKVRYIKLYWALTLKIRLWWLWHSAPKGHSLKYEFWNLTEDRALLFKGNILRSALCETKACL